MANGANGSQVKVTQFGTRPARQARGPRPTVAVVTGRSSYGESLPITRKDGSEVYKIELVVDRPDGDGLQYKLEQWSEVEMDLAGLVGELVEFEVEQFKVSQYGRRLHRDAKETYILVGRLRVEEV